MNIEEIVDNFNLFDDWEDKYTYLIDLGREIPPMNPALKTEENRVKGCISQIWMVLEWGADGRISLTADSDAQIAKGLVAILYFAFSGKTAAEAARVDISALFARMGLDRYLTPNRRNGFYAMVERIAAFTAGCT